jgi:Regulator of chromosome condensation (RCC1) repeat
MGTLNKMSLLSLIALACCGCLSQLQREELANLPVAAAGFLTTCVMSTSGTLSCWGTAIGDGSTSGSVGPAAMGIHDSPITPLGIGIVKAVALTAAWQYGCVINGDRNAPGGGTVSCWNGTDAPTQAPNLTDAIGISVGGLGVCAIKVDRTVLCWLPPGGHLTSVSLDTSLLFASTPTSVPGLQGLTIVNVSVGKDFACVRTLNNDVLCWGANNSGQLGRGTLTAKETVAAPIANLKAVAVAAGESHACAILPANNTIECWGADESGQLGNGVIQASPFTTPQPVSGIAGALHVAAGASFTCASLTNTNVECWGANGSGQLGNGTSGANAVPTSVTSLSGAILVSTGTLHACASGLGLLERCWGHNANGELTDGKDYPLSTGPVP